MTSNSRLAFAPVLFFALTASAQLVPNRPSPAQTPTKPDRGGVLQPRAEPQRGQLIEVKRAPAAEAPTSPASGPCPDPKRLCGPGVNATDRKDKQK